MGRYVNKGNADFAEARNQEYVDKSGLIGFVNRTLMEVLVGVKYDKRLKRHECRIERWGEFPGVNSRSNEKNSRSKTENSWSRIEKMIVEFCSEPKSLEEIAMLVGSKDKYYMKKKFINPILGVRLRMTEPNSPNSPTHKYVRIFE